MFDIQYLMSEWYDKGAILPSGLKHVLKQGMKIVGVSVNWKWVRLVTCGLALVFIFKLRKYGGDSSKTVIHSKGTTKIFKWCQIGYTNYSNIYLSKYKGHQRMPDQHLYSIVLLTLVLLNPDIPCLCKQCRSRSVGFWRSNWSGSALFVIQYVNLYQ